MSFRIGVESPAEAFEPLAEYVTWKTTFLVLLASTSRKGEVDSFDNSKVHPSSKWTSVTWEP